MKLVEIREEIEGRLAELRPLVDEARQLESVLAAIDGIPAPEPEEPTAWSDVRLPKHRRKQQVLAILVGRGSIRIKDLARALGVSHSRAVQLANELEAEGMLSRTAEGLEVTDQGAREVFGGGIKVLGAVQREPSERRAEP